MDEIKQYPLDETSVSDLNHVPNELHELKDEDRFIIPRGGCFYAHNFNIVDAVTKEPLKLDIDYELGNFYQKASIELAMGVWGSIILKTPVKRKVLLDIHYVGGKYSVDVPGLTELVKSVAARGLNVFWDDIIKPESGVDAKYHPHHTDDFKGTQDVCDALLVVAEQITKPRERPEGIHEDDLEARLKTNWVDVPEGDYHLESEHFDGRTIITAGSLHDTTIHIQNDLVLQGPLSIYAAHHTKTSIALDDKVVVINSDLLEDELSGMTITFTPLSINNFVITDASKVAGEVLGGFNLRTFWQDEMPVNTEKYPPNTRWFQPSTDTEFRLVKSPDALIEKGQWVQANQLPTKPKGYEDVD